jgi:L-lactate permease
MTLDYVALLLLVVIIALVVYGVVAVWGIPYEIAKQRNHPHQDAIGAATWVSLFTLGVLWPFLWIWAMAYRPDRGWGFAKDGQGADASFAQFEDRLSTLERAQQKQVV